MIETTVDLNEITISNPPGTIIGYRVNGQPVYNIAGGSVDVSPDDDDDDDDDNDDSDDSDDDEKDEWVPPTKEDFEKLVAAKQKADSEAAARKRYLREAGFDPKTGKAVQKPKVELNLNDDDDDDDDEPVVRTKAKKPEFDAGKTQKDLQRQLEREVARAEQSERRRSTALIAAVPEALEDAGWNGRNMNRMLKLLDLDSVDVDSDGEVDGLKDQIEELKKDFPEFFKRQRMKEAAKEIADTKTIGGGKKKAPEAGPTDWATSIATALSRS